MSRFVPHVGPTLGYRIEWEGHSVAYISDHQQPYDGSLRASDGALELAQGVDLLIHDSQFTQDEFAQKFNWGHCTVDYAVWFA
jgi:ribonuclease BN (tRNA processing enzyme)